MTSTPLSEAPVVEGSQGHPGRPVEAVFGFSKQRTLDF